jgi:DNA-binding HxlR family transcriptional regulator
MAEHPGHHALDRTLARVGDRWTLLLVNALLDGPQRFNELQAGLGGIATNVLSHRLKRLEHEGIVVAHRYSDRPPRYAYELTAPGRELAGALRLLSQWGIEQGPRGSEGGPDPRGTHRHRDDEAPVLAHGACGTPLETRWYCPTCDEPVDEETAQLRFV